jgi:hypothetical protein
MFIIFMNIMYVCNKNYSSNIHIHLYIHIGHHVDVMSVWDSDNDTEKNHHTYNARILLIFLLIYFKCLLYL